MEYLLLVLTFVTLTSLSTAAESSFITSTNESSLIVQVTTASNCPAYWRASSLLENVKPYKQQKADENIPRIKILTVVALQLYVLMWYRLNTNWHSLNKGLSSPFSLAPWNKLTLIQSSFPWNISANCLGATATTWRRQHRATAWRSAPTFMNSNNEVLVSRKCTYKTISFKAWQKLYL